MQYIYLDDKKQWFASKFVEYNREVLRFYHEPCSEFGNKGRGIVGPYVKKEKLTMTYGSDNDRLPMPRTSIVTYGCNVCGIAPNDTISKKFKFLEESLKGQ